MKIGAHSYKAFRERIWGDRLIKLINLMLRSAECGVKKNKKMLSCIQKKLIFIIKDFALYY